MSDSAGSIAATAIHEQPDSNQTLTMSCSGRKSPPPHALQVVPGGISSDGARVYQASAPSVAKISATCSMVSASAWTSPQPWQ